ncbi:hypothetical protein V6N13_113660 [Hibiscus sabdariffa]
MTASCWGICSTMCCREKLAPNSWPRSRGFDSSLRFVQFGPEVKCHCGASNCQEGFSILLNEDSRNKSIKGVTIGRQRLEVGHLLFANDNILFSEASLAAANALKRVIVTYDNASESLFDTVHVRKICAIPLAKSELSDELVWRYDGSGKYTVKSGYPFECTC